MKFRNIGGLHEEPDKKMYPKGSVIDSGDRDLRKLHGEKFERVDDDTPASQVPLTVAETPRLPDDQSQFAVSQGQGLTEPREIGNKDALKAGGPPRVLGEVTASGQPASVEKENEGKGKESQIDAEGMGENMTNRFPEAEKLGLVVYRKNHNYGVFKGDDVAGGNVEVLNKQEITTIKGVTDFLKDLDKK